MFMPTKTDPVAVIAPSRPETPRKATGIPSQALFHGEREIAIEHGGQLYRLSITRQNKLILTK